MAYMKDSTGVRLDSVAVSTKVTVDTLPTSGLYYAHRGSSRDGRPMALEGSRSAYRAALALGAHVLDADVRRTRDGVLMVGLHDAATASVSDVTVTVASTGFIHLPQHSQAALIGSGHAKEDFLTVEEFFREFGGRAVLDCELKGGTADLADFAALVTKYGLKRSVLVNTSSASDALAIDAAGLLVHFVNVRSNAHVDSAQAANAWMIDVAVDATPGTLLTYAAGKFQRIIGGFVNMAGTAIQTDTFGDVAALHASLNGYASDALGYLGRTGGANTRSSSSIAGMVSTGKRSPGLKIVNSGGLTDWLTPGNLYVRKGSGVMVYTFGSLSGTYNTTQTLTFKAVFDTLPTTTTESVRWKIFSPTEDPANASANTVEGYVLGLQADGVVFLNSIPVGGGTPTSVFANISGAALVAGTEYTVTVEIDDTAPNQKIRVTRVDTGGSSGWVTEGAKPIWRGMYHSAYTTMTTGQARLTDLSIA